MEYVWKSSLWIGIFQRARTQEHNQQEYYWPTIYKTEAAVVSTITSNNNNNKKKNDNDNDNDNDKDLLTVFLLVALYPSY